MAYSDAVARRVRDALGGQPGLSEKEMFGGIAFLVHGNMAVGVHESDLIVRVEPAETDALLREPGARVFALSGGRTPRGWLLVGPNGFQREATLKAWIARGVEYASTLPKKAARGKPAKGTRARR